MTTTPLIVAQTPTPATATPQLNDRTIGAAIGTLRQRYAGQARKIKALHNARTEFSAQRWMYDYTTRSIKVWSASDVAQKRSYIVTPDQPCPCKAGQNGQTCFHAMMLEAIQEAIRAQTAPAAPAKPRMSEAEYQQLTDSINADLF